MPMHHGMFIYRERLGDDFQEWGLSSHHAGPGHETQVTRLWDKCLQVSHLSSPALVCEDHMYSYCLLISPLI